jgi:hypothetical protein
MMRSPPADFQRTRRSNVLRRFAIGLIVALGIAAPVIAIGSERELIYGSELMNDNELDRYRADMQKLPNAASKDRYRERHREQLRERARGRGVVIDEPAGVIQRKERK